MTTNKRSKELTKSAGGARLASESCGISRQRVEAWIKIPEKHEATIKKLVLAGHKKNAAIIKKYYG